MIRKSARIIITSAVAVVTCLGLAGCGGSPSGSGSSSGGAVNLTLWTNATTGNGLTYFQNAISTFESQNPNVTITLTSIQNEDIGTKLQTALNSNSAPDIFFQQGGGNMVSEAQAGQIKDLTSVLTDQTKSAFGSGILQAVTSNGKIYALPTSVQPSGFFYSEDLFKQAGITSTPTTIPELQDAVAKLKAAGITPIALGAKDGWPASQWFFQFVIRECSSATLDAAASSLTFNDPCFLQAAEDVQNFASTDPFQSGYLTTSAQQGAGSSAGLVANHQASMELMGMWDPGVIQSLTPDQQPLADLGWFPFPSVSGGQGDPTAMLASSDAYSLSAKAPAQAGDFLNFLASADQQKLYAAAFATLPANQQALDSVSNDPINAQVIAAYKQAGYVSNYLDLRFGQALSDAMNSGVVDLLSGKTTPQGLIDTMNTAGAQG